MHCFLKKIPSATRWKKKEEEKGEDQCNRWGKKKNTEPPMYLGGRSELGPRHSAFGMRNKQQSKQQNKKQQQRTAAAPRTPQEKQQQSSSNNNNTNNKARWYSLDRDPSWPVMMFRLTW